MAKGDMTIQEAIELRNKLDVVISMLLNEFYQRTGLAVESVAVIQNKISGDEAIVDIKHRVITSVGIKGHSYE